VVTTINRGRYQPEIAPGREPVLFLVGMRINHPLRFWTWLPVVRAMTSMISELMRNRDLGLLRAPRTFVSGRVIQVQQYWESFEHLERYARNAERRHLPAWRRFNARVRDNGAVGIYHETYRIRPGGWEAIYGNRPDFGLAAATSVVPVASGRSAAQRLGDRDSDTQPVEGY
jgi:hypothetical protein